tara:strand:- start:1400 stop:1648 length:249 start_codon:yes stop_codon:yes gene_type:complete
MNLPGKKYLPLALFILLLFVPIIYRFFLPIFNKVLKIYEQKKSISTFLNVIFVIFDLNTKLIIVYFLLFFLHINNFITIIPT